VSFALLLGSPGPAATDIFYRETGSVRIQSPEPLSNALDKLA